MTFGICASFAPRQRAKVRRYNCELIFARSLAFALFLPLAMQASATGLYGDLNSLAQAQPDGRLAFALPPEGGAPDRQELPANKPGTVARYLCEPEAGLPATVVRTFSMGWGQSEQTSKGDCRWLFVEATKASGQEFRVWLLTDGYPADTLAEARRHLARFIVQPGNATPLEFRDRVTGEAVLPSLGGWYYLLPRAADAGGVWPAAEGFPKRTEYLGHRYRLLGEPESVVAAGPPKANLIDLRPEVLVGVPGNTRQQEAARRYDGSDYKLRRLTCEDFREMAEAGINCVRVDAEQRAWVEDLAVFYWGVGGPDVPYPECLYDSRYLGPALFLDEPAVHTRDYVIRPRLAKEEAFRQALTPRIMLEAFEATFARACLEGAPVSLLQGLAARADVDLGAMKFRQANLFSWETMVSTAAYQLSQDPQVPSALVFEPPGRVGTLKTLPEFDMSYGCQIPVDDPKSLGDIIYGFLRGAARLTGKQWGASIYGAVDRADAPWLLTHAYDLGATRFFFWDSAGLACVPYPECLGLARQLKMRAENRPQRDLGQLRRAAEVVILLPPGYNLGHVQLGRGSLWGLGELNLERMNQKGVKYREVMGRFFTEIERCQRLGVAFDLLWDLPGAQLSAYREIVRVREDGKVEVREAGKQLVLDHARLPVRPPGLPPALEVVLSTNQGSAPLRIDARAQAAQTTAPLYYTLGADPNGIYHNAVVAWELYGPGAEDYRVLTPPGLRPQVAATGGRFEVTLEFVLHRPGKYRLRAATVDLAGRSTVRWTPIIVTE
jgi:hypothetical protein